MIGGKDTTLHRYKQLVDRISWSSDKPKYTTESNSVIIDAGLWSSFISLTLPDVEDLIPIIDDLRIGVDALELRVDLLRDYSPLSLHRQIAQLRDICPLPVVFTVRTKGQIGKFDDHAFDEIGALLREGILCMYIYMYV